MTETPDHFFPRDRLVSLGEKILSGAGLEPGLASLVAEVLVEADMMGHATHGLALVPTYVKALESGAMARSGEPEVLRDVGGCVTWNGGRLPGAFLVRRAVDLGCDRAERLGVCTVAITNSYHMGALAVYVRRAAERGMMAILASSTPSVDGVAPFGGIRGVMTPNPLAAGIPTGGDPILLDISASITTRNKAAQYAAAGKRFPGQWAQDRAGNPTDDPGALLDGGTLLPVGGIDHGHKGYALGLLVEALTQGFSGVGRADHPTGTYTAAFVQVLNPAFFAGAEPFTRNMSYLADACRSTPPRQGVAAVRVPGDQAARLIRQSEVRGVPVSEQIMQALRDCCGALGVVLSAEMA
ncbi:Ldh family oxidoreductase [Sinirhodobacter populi]|uniref:Ldh family oxidoreductase n=1 Tax=Paenirhodobacter populi TaxID=2306993 RepID=A0A443K2T5_9RHOB|nr:Ldh family oxidoreductase [Sinirhodobacter populi]RWR27081.1 Ldh family oxidoreductase [Sinirhodobacter populi]